MAPSDENVHAHVPMKCLRETIWPHLLDCLALGCSVTLVYSAVETWLLGMPVAMSIKARAITLTLILLGVGTVFSRLRAWSIRKTFVHESNSRFLRVAHDMTFTLVVNALVAPAVYSLAGAAPAQIVMGTAATVLISIVSGPINGLAIDLFRSWAGLDSSGRFPRHSPAAVSLILGAVAAFALLTITVYVIAAS